MSSPADARSLPFPLGTRELIFMLAFSQALQALAIDLMLPALGEIARDLGTADPNRRQLVIGLFLAGLGFGALVPGMLADRFGRRPVLLGCIAGFVVPASPARSPAISPCWRCCGWCRGWWSPAWPWCRRRSCATASRGTAWRASSR